MSKVEIYTTMWCPFCYRAKHLLSSKGIDFNEIDVGGDNLKRDEMVKRANGRRTVPQIFIDGLGIGGSDELADLEAKGDLDPLLGLV